MKRIFSFFFILFVILAIVAWFVVATSPLTYQWSRVFQGTTTDDALVYDNAIDASGNVYIAGLYDGTVDFDPSDGTDNHMSDGNYDIFVTKLSSNGGYIWTRTMGSSGVEDGGFVAVDSSGNVYVTGSFNGTVDFDPSGATDNHSSAGLNDIFLTKLTADGTYGWTKTFGAGSLDDGEAIGVDASDNIYVGGLFRSTVDFDPSGSTDNHSAVGGQDAFVSKFTSSGAFVWAKTFGGTQNELVDDIALDSSGIIYLVGTFAGTADFDPSGSTDNHSSNGDDDIFISKLTSSGDFVWAKIFGGDGTELGGGIKVVSDDAIYVGGQFTDSMDFDPSAGSDIHANAGLTDTFISKFSADGTYAWTRTFGGAFATLFHDMAVSNNLVYVSGDFQDGVTDFDPTSGVDNRTADSSFSSGFAVGISTDGAYEQVLIMTGDQSTVTNGVAMRESNLYVSGYFKDSIDLDGTTGVDNFTPTSTDFNGFVSRYTLPISSTAVEEQHDSSPSDSSDVHEPAAFFPAEILQPFQKTTTTRDIRIKAQIQRSDAFLMIVILSGKRYRMYDDGKHADGVKGDLIYSTDAISVSKSASYTISTYFFNQVTRAEGRIVVKQ